MHLCGIRLYEYDDVCQRVCVELLNDPVVVDWVGRMGDRGIDDNRGSPKDQEPLLPAEGESVLGIIKNSVYHRRLCSAAIHCPKTTRDLEHTRAHDSGDVHRRTRASIKLAVDYQTLKPSSGTTNVSWLRY